MDGAPLRSRPTGHRARRRFGQHFLTDGDALARIADLAVGAGDADLVIEVGPGTGSLTAELLARLSRLVAVEIDRDLIRHLRERFRSSPLRLIEGDVLNFDLAGLLEEEASGGQLVVVGNLPFNISSPTLFHLLDHACCIERAVLMLQKEVAQRVVAAPGSKRYGTITVLLQQRAFSHICFDVPRTSFRPRPKVDATVVELAFSRERRFPVKDEKLFESVVRTAFGQRRKMLRNALRSLPPLHDGGYVTDDQLESAAATSGLDLTRRAETLEGEEFASFSDALLDVAGKTG